MSRFPQKRETAQTLLSRREYASLSLPSTLRATCILLILQPIFPTHADLPAPTQQPPQTICSECQNWEGSESGPLIFQTDTLRHYNGRGQVLRLPLMEKSHHVPPPCIPVCPWNQLEWMTRAALEEDSSDPQEDILFYPGVNELPPLLPLLLLHLAGSSEKVIRARTPTSDL